MELHAPVAPNRPIVGLHRCRNLSGHFHEMTEYWEQDVRLPDKSGTTVSPFTFAHISELACPLRQFARRKFQGTEVNQLRTILARNDSYSEKANALWILCGFS